jgi:integrase
MTTEYLLNQEVGHVLAALTPQNALIMEVVLQTGLRVSDVLELRTADLKPSMWVTEKKTGKKHRCGLPKELLAKVLNQANDMWAFPSPTDPAKHKSRQAVWKDVKRASKAFRLRQNIGTHSFRKVYAVRLMHKYGDIRRVQRALSHSNPSVTAIYAMADELMEDKEACRLRRLTGTGRRPDRDRPGGPERE